MSLTEYIERIDLALRIRPEHLQPARVAEQPAGFTGREDDEGDYMGVMERPPRFEEE